jgi:hypothetical protein
MGTVPLARLGDHPVRSHEACVVGHEFVTGPEDFEMADEAASEMRKRHMGIHVDSRVAGLVLSAQRDDGGVGHIRRGRRGRRGAR